MKKLSDKEIQDRLKQLSGWAYKDGVIQKNYEFGDFKETFALMARIAFECEAMNHHPDWSNVYNSLTVKLNTHDANGVTEKDFKLAQKIEAIVTDS